MRQSIPWEKVKPLIENDISENGFSRGEFVVTAMTKAIANTIQFYIKNGKAKHLPALDIGTGTGYHSALLLAKEQKRTISVDINPKALHYAKQRLANYFNEVKQYEEADFEAYIEKSAKDDQSINFYNYALDELQQNQATNYGLVSFNPPILYPFLKTQFGKPATHGVYYENKEVEKVENDLVYKLYRSIAQNNLKKGSHIVCIWANLNRHLVELNPFEGSEQNYVHPARILEHWFDFKFENEAESFDDFYCHKTILGAGFFNQSETGKLYSANLRHGIENDYYSKLLIPSEAENLSGTYFHFGVLHLEKTSETENTFKIINGSSIG